MDEQWLRAREERILGVIEELGSDRETAIFAVALSDGVVAAGPHVIRLPLPDEEARRRAALLVEQHEFTPEEADCYVAGDRRVLDAVFARRAAAAAERERLVRSG